MTHIFVFDKLFDDKKEEIKMHWSAKDYDTAFQASFQNKIVLAKSKVASCYFCLRTFPTNQIIDFTDDDCGICPSCTIDTR